MFICMTQFLSNSLRDRRNVYKYGEGALNGTVLASISAKISGLGRGGTIATPLPRAQDSNGPVLTSVERQSTKMLENNGT